MTAARTVCIAVNNGFSIRYVIQSGILSRLLDSGHRVVILAPDDEAVHIRQSVPGEVDVWEAPQVRRPSRMQRYLSTLRFYLRAEYTTTPNEVYRRMYAETKSRWGRMVLRALHGLAEAMRGSRTARRLVPTLEARLDRDPRYDTLLKEAGADLVVVTSHGVFGFDMHLAHAAARLDIPIATLILSWDNITSGMYPAYYAKCVIAWSRRMKEDVVRLLDYRPEEVTVCGVAHFDIYRNPDRGYSRDETLKAQGLNPDRRTILFATKSPNSFAWNPNVARTIADAISDGRLPNCQLAIRPHPIHYRKDPDGTLRYRAPLDLYDELAEEFDFVVVNKPAVVADSSRYAMDGNEMLTVSRLLRASDVLVNMFSTMNIEGALLDKPLVNVCYEDTVPLYPFEPNPRFDIFSDARESHNQRIVDSGGTRIAYSPVQLVEHVADYLDRPALDADGRRLIVETEGGPYGGNAAKIIADTMVTIR